jgi:uncharacterized protein
LASTGFEGFGHYCTRRAQHQRPAKSLTWTSIDHMAFFDAFHFDGQKPGFP